MATSLTLRGVKGERLTTAEMDGNLTALRTTADGAAQKASNLSDLASAATARSNLGLGTAATQASTAFAAASHTHVVGDVTGAAALAGATFTGRIASTPVALTDGATVTINCSLGNIFTLTLGGNRTLALSNLAAGQYVVRITQDGTGGRTLTWPAAFKWAGGVAGVLSTAAGAVDVLAFTSFDGSTAQAVLRDFA